MTKKCQCEKCRKSSKEQLTFFETTALLATYDFLRVPRNKSGYDLFRPVMETPSNQSRVFVAPLLGVHFSIPDP
jgi:hypothetical protein